MNQRLRALVPPGLAIEPAVWAELAAAYGEPGRHYHDVSHVVDVAERFAEAAPWARPHEVFVAVLYHDAVYRPGRSDNEAASARMARAGWRGSAVDLDRVSELIELTAAHGKLAPDDVDPEAARFLDCDMAILGAGAEAFAAYDRGVAREYAPFVPAAAFAAGRAAFLERLLAAPRIFLSDDAHRRLDGSARENLGCALGAARFDAGAYWDAHEAWETVWKGATDEIDRHGLQGLIQCAAAMVQVGRGRKDGARAVLKRAAGHFARVGPRYRAIDLGRLVADIEARIAGTCEDRLTLRVEPD